jgi:hypothetical protein
MKILRNRLLVSLVAGHSLLFFIWVIFTLTDHHYTDIFEGSVFHIAVSYCLLWPYLVIYALKLSSMAPWLVWVVLYLLDVLAYSVLAHGLLCIFTSRKRKAYHEE